jgi:hypothetical protein
MLEDSGTYIEVWEEELDEDLWDYVEDGMVKHPLLYMSLGGKSGVARCNSFFHEKADAAYRARRSRDWEKLLFLHERPHRLAAFEEIESEQEDNRRNGAPRLVTASMEKGGIHAYFDRRDEREVVIESPNILSIDVIAQSKAGTEALKKP